MAGAIIMKIYVLLSASKSVLGQFDAILPPGGLSIFSPFGLSDADVFGETGNDDLADAMERFQNGNDSGEDDLFGFQRFGPSRARLPPGIRVMDFVENGQFDKEAFRRALKAALRAQEEREAGASAEFNVSTTPLTSTTSGFTTPGSTTTSTTLPPTTTKATRATRRAATTQTTLAPRPPTVRSFSKAPRARPPQTPRPMVRLAQGASDEFNYCRKCNGQTEAECITSNNVETCNKAATRCVVTIRQSQWRGQLKYWSGCAQANSCQAQEKQNFHSMMRYSQCLPPMKIGRRYFRSIKCNFCHKMGTGSGTHLLFQLDENGTNDPNSILTFDGSTYAAQSISDILDNPSGFLQTDNISNLQNWY